MPSLRSTTTVAPGEDPSTKTRTTQRSKLLTKRPAAESVGSHNREVLKKRFFGKPLPPVEDRRSLALAELQKPEALAILRQRKSFRHFEAQLQAWR